MATRRSGSIQNNYNNKIYLGMHHKGINMLQFFFSIFINLTLLE